MEREHQKRVVTYAEIVYGKDSCVFKYTVYVRIHDIGVVKHCP